MPVHEKKCSFHISSYHHMSFTRAASLGRLGPPRLISSASFLTEDSKKISALLFTLLRLDLLPSPPTFPLLFSIHCRVSHPAQATGAATAELSPNPALKAIRASSVVRSPAERRSLSQEPGLPWHPLSCIISRVQMGWQTLPDRQKECGKVDLRMRLGDLAMFTGHHSGT